MPQNNYNTRHDHAFTIVELLVVIVVIGILAAITIVSYTGITSKANIASLKSDLNGASKLLNMDQIVNNTYPATLAAANGGKGIPSSSGTAYQYTVNNSNPQTFCITATKGAQSYSVGQDNITLAGPCPVLRLDTSNPVSYPGTGTNWYDLSGNNNNGILANGVGYNNASGGVLSFDGVDDYLTVNNTASLNGLTTITIGAWVYPVSDVYIFQHGSSWYINGYLNYFKVTASGALYLDIEDSVTNAHFTVGSSNGVVQMNKWNYVNTVVRDNLLEFYVNGNKVYTSTTFNGMYPLANCSNETRNIGRYYYNSITAAGYSNGSIGDIRIYNKALSADDIQQNYNALRGRYGM